MKKPYEKARMDVLLLSSTDIIRTSDKEEEQEGNGNNAWGEWDE